MTTLIADVIQLICRQLSAAEITRIRALNSEYCALIDSIAVVEPYNCRHICVYSIKIGAITKYYFRGRTTDSDYTGEFTFCNGDLTNKLFVIDGKVQYMARCSNRIKSLVILVKSIIPMKLYDYLDEIKQCQISISTKLKHSYMMQKLFDHEFASMAPDKIVDSPELTRLLERYNYRAINDRK